MRRRDFIPHSPDAPAEEGANPIWTYWSKAELASAGWHSIQLGLPRSGGSERTRTGNLHDYLIPSRALASSPDTCRPPG